MENQFKKIAEESEKKFNQLLKDLTKQKNKYEKSLALLKKENTALYREIKQFKNIFQQLSSKNKPLRKTKKCISLDKKVKVKHYRQKNYIKMNNSKKKYSKNSVSLHEGNKIKSGYLLKK